MQGSAASKTGRGRDTGPVLSFGMKKIQSRLVSFRPVPFGMSEQKIFHVPKGNPEFLIFISKLYMQTVI